METYIQTGLGIIVSVLLFLIGYRQTIGARKERIKTANEKILETILRRLILENYEPKKEDIKRLIEGKARDYKVKQRDLLSVDQIINTIYTRIFENDLISQQQREENVERLSNLFLTDKKEIRREVEQVLTRSKDSNRKVFNYLVILLGLLSAIIGVSIVSFDKLVNFESELNSNILLTMLASVLAIFTSYIFLRFKDNQESSDEKDSPRNLHRVAFRFERDIMRSLKKQNFDITIPNEKNSGFDLYVSNGQKNVGVIIKYWRNRPPFSYLKQLISRIDLAMEKEKVSESYIITNDTHDLGKKIKFDKNISIVTINDLKNKLRTNNSG